MNGMNRAFIDAYKTDLPAATTELPPAADSIDLPPPNATVEMPIEPKTIEPETVEPTSLPEPERFETMDMPRAGPMGAQHFGIESLLAERPAVSVAAQADASEEDREIVGRTPEGTTEAMETANNDFLADLLASPPSHQTRDAVAQGPEPALDSHRTDFRPHWEIDGFRWPPVCRKLNEMIGPELDGAAGRLEQLVATGENIVAIGGSTRNRGTTTLGLCLARAAAARGMNVALVDADFESPELARRLGVSIETAWQQVSAEQGALEEAAVRSAEDGIVLFGASQDNFDGIGDGNPADVLRLLAGSFDVVLVDVGPIDENTCSEAGHPLFAVRPSPVRKAVLVVDARHVDADGKDDVQRLLGAVGIETAALMENFARRAA